MAIDDRAKRASTVGILLPSSPRVVFQSGAIDAASRQDSARIYRGLLATSTIGGRRQWRRTVRKVAGMRGIR